MACRASPRLLPSVDDASVQCNKTFERCLEIEATPSPGWARCQSCPWQWRGSKCLAVAFFPPPCAAHVAKRGVRWGEESSYFFNTVVNWLLPLGAWCVFKADTWASGTFYTGFQKPAPCPPPQPCYLMLCIPNLPFPYFGWRARSGWPLVTFLLAPGSQGPSLHTPSLLIQGEAESPYHLPPWMVRLKYIHSF